MARIMRSGPPTIAEVELPRNLVEDVEIHTTEENTHEATTLNPVDPRGIEIELKKSACLYRTTTLTATEKTVLRPDNRFPRPVGGRMSIFQAPEPGNRAFFNSLLVIIINPPIK